MSHVVVQEMVQGLRLVAETSVDQDQVLIRDRDGVVARVPRPLNAGRESWTLADCERAESLAQLLAAAPAMADALLYIVNWNRGSWSPEQARDRAKFALRAAGLDI